jgi:hypothetical protein
MDDSEVSDGGLDYMTRLLAHLQALILGRMKSSTT